LKSNEEKQNMKGFCKTCGWNLVKVPIGTKTKWGIATKERPHYYNHSGCKTGEESVEVTA